MAESERPNILFYIKGELVEPHEEDFINNQPRGRSKFSGIYVSPGSSEAARVLAQNSTTEINIGLLPRRLD